MRNADCNCRKRPAAVMQLLVSELALASRALDGVCRLLGDPSPICIISRPAGKEANQAAFGVNNWVSGSARLQCAVR